jgi:hypothetical protein
MNISEVLPNGNVRVVVPITIRTVRQGKRIVVADNKKSIQMQTPLLQSIANGIMWQRWLDEGRYRNINELAEAVGRDRAIVSHTLQLAMLSPEIVHMAIAGTLPSHISFKNFKAGLPADWTEQKRFLGLL